MATGWDTSCRAMTCQSANARLDNCEMRNRGPLLCSWCCNALNRCCELCKAKVMLRSSPRSFCHWRRVVCRRRMKLLRSEDKRSWRCAGNCIVMAALSTSQPRSRLRVLKVASPFSTFETETMGRRGEWTSSWNILCKCCRTLLIVRSCVGYCANIMKSSIYTSV